MVQNNMYLLVNIILHVLILFTILCSFFLFYISRIEQKTYENEIRKAANSLKEQLEEHVTKDQKPEVQNVLKQLPFDDLLTIYNKPAKSTTTNNNWLKLNAWLFVAFLFIVFIQFFLICQYKCCCNVSFAHLIFENIVIFIIVGAIEIGFFVFIASKYVPVKPSTMTNIFINSVKDKILE